MIEDWNREQSQTIPSINTSLSSKKVFFLSTRNFPITLLKNRKKTTLATLDNEVEQEAANFNHVLLDSISLEHAKKIQKKTDPAIRNSTKTTLGSQDITSVPLFESPNSRKPTPLFLHFVREYGKPKQTKSSHAYPAAWKTKHNLF